MLKTSKSLLRLGKPRIGIKQTGMRYGSVPMTHKPLQGGQNLFHQYLLQQANEEAIQQQRNNIRGGIGGDEAFGVGDRGSDTAAGSGGRSMDLIARHPMSDFAANRMATPEKFAAADADAEAGDLFESRRAFNELAEYEEFKRRSETAKAAGSANTSALASSAAITEDVTEDPATAAVTATPLPDDIRTDDYVKSTFGYSMLKGKPSSSLPPVDVQYSELDMWAEQPKYNPGTYFLYLVSRRRNVYAVLYDFEGKRMLNVYSAGNRGFKESDKGFRAEGSAETAHQVTSQYLNDVIPKVREAEIAAGRQRPGDSKKIEIVIRLLGFYNGRSGAIRAVNDRSDVFDVRYMEDITPFPLNGPRLPKRKPKMAGH